MFLSNLFLALLAAPPVLADKCDAAIPGPLSDNARASLQRLSKKQAQPPPPTPLYVHIVAGSKDRKDGYLSETEVESQISLIETAFLSYNITFIHTSSMRNWVVNASWSGSDRQFREMKSALHLGDYRSLNLYFRHVDDPAWGGTCTNPWTEKEYWGTPLPRLLLDDGCVVNDLTVPGSAHEYMNLGKTAIHEIGHWFGLFHVHEAGDVRNGLNPPDTCWIGNPDDWVEDTPKMRAVGIGKCDKTQNSCPEGKGEKEIFDPVDNYMSYASDECMARFTDGQRERMWAIYEAYRRGVPY